MEVDDLHGVDAARPQELGDRRFARLGELDEIAQRGEVRRELVVVEQDPAPDLAALVIIRCAELAGDPGQVIQDHAGLAEALAVMLENRHFAHLVELGSIVRCAGFAVEEVDPHGLPRKLAQLQHQGHLVGVAGFTHAVEPVFRHHEPLPKSRYLTSSTLVRALRTTSVAVEPRSTPSSRERPSSVTTMTL